LTYRPALPLSPLPGLDFLQGENGILFNRNSMVGPHAFTAFAKGTYEFDKTTRLYFGPYLVSGQTETDSVAQGALFRGDSKPSAPTWSRRDKKT
jgi:hypothetical protein